MPVTFPFALNAERSHSGLVHRSRKPEWLNGHRGFESHPLRHVIFEDSRLQDLHDCYRIYLLILKNLVNPVNDYLKGRGAGVVELAALEML